MRIHFFIALAAFSFLWVLEAQPNRQVEQEWVFRGLENQVDALTSLVRGLKDNLGTDSEELNLFMVNTLQKERCAMEMTRVFSE